MSIIEAVILGILQGLTEFLPVSSSGHLELGKIFMHIPEEGMAFTVAVHGATILSTIVVFRNDIWQLIHGLFNFKWDDDTKYVAKIVLSMIPAVIVGLLFEAEIDAMFAGNLSFVASMLLVTGALLAFTHYAKPRTGGLTFRNAFIIGVAQAIAIIPGISRSGSTIATGLLLGARKEDMARFSFLMVVPLILGANAKQMLDGGMTEMAQTELIPVMAGFVAAFITGLLACTLMIKIVKQGKLIWFAYYCFAVGTIALTISFL